MQGPLGRATVAAAGQTLALGRGLVAALRGEGAAERYAQAQASAMQSAVPSIARAVLVIMCGYVVAQLWFRPAQVWAAWPAYVVQIATAALLLVGMRSTWLRHRAETAFAVGEFAFTTSLVLQLLSPETAPAGIAGFIAIKLMATALFVPWRARRQYLSVAYTLAIYGLALAAAPHLANEDKKLHLVAVPVIAGLLSALGTARAVGLRRTLLDQTAERETAVARLQLVLDSMPVGCIISDASLRYVYWNRAAEDIFGYKVDEVVGKSAVDVITPPHLRELSVRGFEELAREDHMLGPMRLENVTKDGRTIVCEWSAVALRNPDGSFGGMLSMCQDVTEKHRDEEARRELIAQLQESDRVRAAFVATLSHELRSPINVILGYHDLLLEGVFGPISSEQREVIDRVGQAARQLLELVTSTLEVSRVQAGRSALNLQLIHPAALLEQIRLETREMQEKEGVEVQWQVPEGLPPIYSDAAKLKVIVRNLLSNALKYTDEGVVRIRAGEATRGLEIEVSDTGYGIPPDALPHIFEPFRQFHTHTGSAGAGLGLYLVRLFADLIGAQLSVQSEVGKGTTFTVSIPLQPPGTLVRP
ncbi:MAG: PAS domain-containing sensor histidine kinase [Candidatus Binatia bacterium]|nr:PAS domain-containing sensor histidine kinase [Candidatus Binatia bacterium]